MQFYTESKIELKTENFILLKKQNLIATNQRICENVQSACDTRKILRMQEQLGRHRQRNGRVQRSKKGIDFCEAEELHSLAVSAGFHIGWVVKIYYQIYLNFIYI